MATKKKTTKKVTRNLSAQLPVETIETPLDSPKKQNPLFLVLVVILLGVLAFNLAKKNRGMFIAGTVNEVSVSRSQLDKTLMTRYGKSTLDELLSIALLDQLASKNGVTVTDEEINTEIKTLEDRLGGAEALKTNMAQFGIDDAKLREELTAVVKQRKLAAKLFEVKLEETEVKKYYDDNKAQYTNKKYEDVKAEIEGMLRDQKLQTQFSEWFNKEREGAKVNTYI